MDGVNPLWKTIKELLDINHTEGLLYCPLSLEHVIETVKKDLQGAIEHDSYFRKLSDGYLLKTDPFLTSQLISSLIRNNKHTVNTFLRMGNPQKIENIYHKINENSEIFDEAITFKTSLVNEIRKASNPRIRAHSSNVLMNAIKQIEIENFKDRLKEYLDKQTIKIRPDTYGEHDFPHWIDQLLYQLTNKHSFKEKQFKQLLNELEKNGFDRIPTLHTKFSLGAYIAVHSKQENTGDHIDLMRISNYLFSCDIFFTDKKRKHEILDLGLDKRYNTKVFSGVKKDLIEVIDLLKTIKTT